MVRRFIPVVLIFLVVMPGCSPVNVDLLAEQIEAEVQKLEFTSTQAHRPAAGAPDVDVENQPTVSPETEETSTPTVTSEPLPETTDIPTPSLTTTQVITAGIIVSPTVVITTTQILTSTWTFSDVVDLQNGTINQVSWVDGTLVAAAASLGLYLYQAEDLSPAGAYNLGEPVLSLAYSPDVELLASGNYKGDIQWRDPFTGEYEAATGGHIMGVTDLAYPEGGLYLISGSDDGTVRTWLPAFVLNQDYLSANSMDLWRGPERITCVDSHPFNSFVVAGSFQRVSVWSPGIGDPVHEIEDLAGWINDLAISPDGDVLAVADSSNYLRLWQTDTWTLTHEIPIESVNQITALDFSHDGSWLALGSKNGAVLVWDMDDNTLTDPFELYPQPVTDLDFHPYEPRLISSFQDGVLRVWTVQP